MEIIEGHALSKLCDYSFGDHLWMSNPEALDGCCKMANAHNFEFLEKAQEFLDNTMTLFIDNVRLYGRPVATSSEIDRDWIQYHQNSNDLLALCYSLPRIKFIIFTSHEDTPIDEHIKIPDNVLGIHAVNAGFFGGKIHPFPYGLQRRIRIDNRLAIMKANVEEDKRVEPQKLLYINCGIERNPEREPLGKFETNDWVTTRFDKDSKYFPYDKYRDFLAELQDHKFMICPVGHGLDCHRNWESLYLRRVPVMKLSPYFTRLMDGFPVLFVNDWSDITPKLLEQNEHLYKQAQELNLKKLDLDLIFKLIVESYE